MIDGFQRLVAGDFSYRLPRSLIRDEEDTLAFSFNTVADELERTFREMQSNEQRLNHAVDMISDALMQVGAGNFDVHVERDYKGDQVDVLAFLVDSTISELRIRVAENEQRFRQIVENASDLIYRTDAQGNFTYANPMVVHAMGFKSESQFLGKPFTTLISPSERHKAKRFYDRQFLSKTTNTYYELPAITQDGREMWLGQNVQLIQEENQITGFQAVARDITKIKQTQEALSLARDQALEASQLKSQLLSRVSHELRTPLGSVLGYADLLQSDAYGILSAEQKKVVNNLNNSGLYLATIINDLLDQAQMASKDFTLHIESFDPASLLEQVRDRIMVLAEKKGLTLTAEIAPDLPEALQGDEKRLMQIITNLVGNAIKFTNAGSVGLRLSLADTLHWAIQVTDTGMGIPKDAQVYIFEPFRQINNAITRENRGTGLGLSIVNQLVEIMDGSVKVESEVGQGSTFTVVLPIIPSREPHSS